MSEPDTYTRTAGLFTADVVENRPLCREHFQLSLRLSDFPEASPGQFMHICPESMDRPSNPTVAPNAVRETDPNRLPVETPVMLRRAFSIARLRRESSGATGPDASAATPRVAVVDIIYRVVGSGTRWMASLRKGHAVSALGPLGCPFPITAKPIAWMVAGGVGLPPMLWLAEALNRAGKQAVAFCGAQSKDLLALEIDDDRPPAGNARAATQSAAEFARSDTPVVISTDDGSLGFHGHIGAALDAYANANQVAPDDVTVYTCGPERMMKYVAGFCAARGIECLVCMERAMACGTGTCQSCVVPIRDREDADGWRYALCCTEGPVFDATRVVWG